MSLSNKINGVREIWQFDNRWQILMNRLFFASENINIYRFRGLEILIDHSAGDANGARELLTSDMYLKFIRHLDLGASVKLLDLGANNGGFPLLLKSEKIDLEKIVCVEFNPNTYSRMVFNINRNFDCKFIPLNVAVCGENKRLNVVFGNSSTSDSIFQQTVFGAENSHQIEGQTFDEIFASEFGGGIVDICKIDVEGAEFEIFLNPHCQMVKNCRYILIEIHHEPNRPRKSVIDRLNELGFDEFEEEKNESDQHFVHLFVNRLLN